MRVWDLPAGYLNRGSLLGEHRELHGLRSILIHGKDGYSRHPETVRWVGCLAALDRRHDLLAAEMRLRGYVDRTPVDWHAATVQWPIVFVDEPGEQIQLLKNKYADKPSGRIPLPGNAHELWAHHKYSVMARDPEEYRRIGRAVAAMTGSADFTALALELVQLLRVAPTPGRLLNALDHMWGYVSSAATAQERSTARQGVRELMQTVVTIAIRVQEPYLLRSTALSELAVYLPREDASSGLDH